MNCPVCGMRFRVEQAKTSCESCPMSKNCMMVRCPNCGFEAVPDKEDMKKIRSMRYGRTNRKG